MILITRLHSDEAGTNVQEFSNVFILSSTFQNVGLVRILNKKKNGTKKDPFSFCVNVYTM